MHHGRIRPLHHKSERRTAKQITEDVIVTTKLEQITVPEGCCPGCGSRYQCEDENSPGYLDKEKLEEMLAEEGETGTVND